MIAHAIHVGDYLKHWFCSLHVSYGINENKMVSAHSIMCD